MNLMISKHATDRVRQRGVRESDIPVILDAGTPIGDDSVYLLSQDVDREIREHKQAIAKLERLRGWRVVIEGQTVITAYRPSSKIGKKLLRGQHRHHQSKTNHQSTDSISRRYPK